MIKIKWTYYRGFRHAFFAFNLSIKIHSFMKINIYTFCNWYFVIYRLFINQPCIHYFTERFWSKHRTIGWTKYALITWWIFVDEWILIDKLKAKRVSKYSIVKKLKRYIFVMQPFDMVNIYMNYIGQLYSMFTF